MPTGTRAPAAHVAQQLSNSDHSDAAEDTEVVTSQCWQ